MLGCGYRTAGSFWELGERLVNGSVKCSIRGCDFETRGVGTRGGRFWNSGAGFGTRGLFLDMAGLLWNSEAGFAIRGPLLQLGSRFSKQSFLLEPHGLFLYSVVAFVHRLVVFVLRGCFCIS